MKATLQIYNLGWKASTNTVGRAKMAGYVGVLWPPECALAPGALLVLSWRALSSLSAQGIQCQAGKWLFILLSSSSSACGSVTHLLPIIPSLNLKIAFVNSLLSFSVEFINTVLVCLLNANSFTAIAQLWAFFFISISHVESWSTVRLGSKYSSNVGCPFPNAERVSFCRVLSIMWQLVCSKHMSLWFVLQVSAEYFWKLDPRVSSLASWK